VNARPDLRTRQSGYPAGRLRSRSQRLCTQSRLTARPLRGRIKPGDARWFAVVDALTDEAGLVTSETVTPCRATTAAKLAELLAEDDSTSEIAAELGRARVDDRMAHQAHRLRREPGLRRPGDQPRSRVGRRPGARGRRPLLGKGEVLAHGLARPLAAESDDEEQRRPHALQHERPCSGGWTELDGRYAIAASTISSANRSWSKPGRGPAQRLTEALVRADTCTDHARIQHHAFVGRRG
jgi:hypothetical protein